MIESEEVEESDEYRDLKKPRKKNQPPKKVSFEVTDEYQKQQIDKIIQDPKIGIISKTLNLLKNPFLNKYFVHDYLNLQNKTTLADYFLDPKLAKMRKPQAHSASEWSQYELDYYNISFEDQSLEQMFGSEIKDCELDDDDVNLFLKKHEGSFFQNYLTEIWTDRDRQKKDYDYYCSLLCTYKRHQTMEASVNRFMGFLLDLNFGKEFEVLPEIPLDLWVDQMKKEAKPDFSLVDIKKEKMKGFLVVEDKSESSKAYAQLIAEGIAVAQQPYWKKDWPVYMILCNGFSMNFLKAQFSETLLENVKNGNDSAEKFWVKSLESDLDVSIGKHLAIIAKIFSVIKNDLRSKVIDK